MGDLSEKLSNLYGDEWLSESSGPGQQDLDVIS